jgi:hypothetical protein
MPLSRDRFARFLTDSLPQWDHPCPSRSMFYREEFLRCQECLDRQREYYSDRAVTDVEAALAKVMAQLDRLIGRLLQQFDVVTGLSGWIDPRQIN